MMKITATLLILSSVLHVKVIRAVMHKDLGAIGCSASDQNTGKEYMYGLDGEVKAYADFTRGKVVYPQPTFMDPYIYPEDEYQAAVGQQQACKANLKTSLSVYKNPPVEYEEPRVSIYPRDPAVVGVANTLICHVTGFYPAPVRVTWARNNLNLTDDITTSIPYINDDLTFTQISSVKFTPEQGDIYSCSAHHPSLTEPETRMWDVDQNQPSVGPDVFCGVGLTLGLLGVAMGTFFLIKGNECN